MKKFFLSVVICLLAVTSMSAKTIVIPTGSPCNIAVTSITRDVVLANGDDVFVGEKLRIEYTLVDLDYYIDGDDVVEVTLAESDFTADKYTVPVPTKYLPYPVLTITSEDEETILIKWSDAQVFDTAFICVQKGTIMSPDPAEQKGWKNVSGDSVYWALGVEPNAMYEIAMEFRRGKGHRTVIESYAHSVLSSNCALIVNLHDSYGDGWNDAYLLFEENGQTETFTIESGREATFNYASHGGALQIYWKKGNYDDECSFEVLDVFGNAFAQKATGECTSLSNGELLHTGPICQPKCAPAFYLTSFKDDTLRWYGEDVASFEVAFLRKSNPTDEEIEAASIEIPAADDVLNYEYVTQLDSSLSCNAFVRAKCKNGFYSEWSHMSLRYSYSPYLPEDQLATPITLNHYEKADLMANSILWGATPATERVFNLTEPTLVRFELKSEYTSTEQWLADVATDTWINLVNDTVLSLSPGRYVYEVRGNLGDYGVYEVYVSRADTTDSYDFDLNKLDSIAVGQTKTINTKDIYRMGPKDNGYYAKIYRLILTDTLDLRLTCTNGEDRNVGFSLAYKGSYVAGGVEYTGILPADTFYIMAGSDVPETVFTLKVENIKRKALNIIDIQPDVVKEGVTDASDWRELNYGVPCKVYRYTPAEDGFVMFALDTLPGAKSLASVYVIVNRDSVNGYELTTGDYSYSEYSVLEVEKDVPYYFLVGGYANTPWRFTLKKDVAKNYDNPKITATVQVGKRYTANFTASDLTTVVPGSGNYFMTKTQFFKVHLEKDKYYALSAESPTVVYSKWYLLHPDSANGSFEGNMVPGMYSQWIKGAAQLALAITVDSTADYIVAVSTDEYKEFTPCAIAFEMDELVAFEETLDKAQAINTPLVEHSTFEGKIKTAYSDSYQFFPYAEEGWRIMYNAVAYNVIIKKYGGFSVRFGGNHDARIFIYDSENPYNPTIVDNYSDNTPEYFSVPSSSYSTMHIYTIVCAFRGLMLENPFYDLEILQGDEEIELIEVTPVADRRSLSCNENDTWREVKNRLSQIYLFAVDSKKNYLFSIANEEQNWEIDLDGQMAHYEVNNSDMHPGYKLANPVEWIDVALTFDNDIPFAIDEVEDGMAPIKVIRDGKLYIITQYGTFDIMGRKVK